MGDLATGTTIAFATSSFTAEILDISISGISRNSHDMGHHGTTGGRPFKPDKTYDPGEITIEILYDPDDQPPITGSPEQVTITTPVPSGSSNGATHVVSAFVTNFDIGLPFEDRMIGSITLKASGSYAFTDAS